MLRAGKLLTVAILVAGASVASAQSVGRVSSAPLNLSAASDGYSRTSRPAPADQIDGVVRASYYQSTPARSVAPAARVASNRGADFNSNGAIPIGSLPPARNVPIYYPTSYSTPTYATQGYPIYGNNVSTGYAPGAANRAPTLIPTAYQQGCGPTGVPTYPISAAPAPYAAPQTAPGARPFVPIARMPNQVYISRGLIGQPVVYVPGQPIRNGLRYILP